MGSAGHPDRAVSGVRQVKLTKAQSEVLARVCKTNGGGVRVRCRVGDDGYGVPVLSTYHTLFNRGLIQGKAGDYETVVHTREGLSLFRQLNATPAHYGQAPTAQVIGDSLCGKAENK